MSPDGNTVLPPTEALPLFVYGTLREGFHNYEAYLEPYIQEKHPARIGSVSLMHIQAAGYPVILPGDGEVTGELVWLNDFAGALPALDRLEGYNGDPRSSTYVRLVKQVHDLTTDETIDAYVYWFNRPIQEIRSETIPVGSGDWAMFMAEADYEEGTRVLGEEIPQEPDERRNRD